MKRLSIIILGFLLVSSLAQIAYAQVPNGPWVDEIRFESEDNEANVVSKMQAGAMDIFLIDFSDADLFETVRTSDVIGYKTAYGLFFELTFNPVGPVFANGQFNPFSNAKIREAMNWLVDRDYIVDEIMQGLGRPKLLPIVSAFPDYGRLAETAIILESKYRHNPEMAREIIFDELADMGAEYEGEQWYYNGEPITIKVLIRPEDQRRQIGDYTADILEEIGFLTDRQYRTSAEASPIWMRGNPADGNWHVYTGGWISTVVSRDDADSFAYFYTDMGLPFPLWQSYRNSPTFYEKAKRLDISDWETFDERMQLMRECAELALQESQRIFLVDQVVPFLYNQDIQVAFDLAGGPNNPIWARTIRWQDEEGGVIRAGNREVLVEPWNPEAGSNWAYDMVIMRALQDRPIMYNPYTGLPMANRFESVEMEVQEGVVTTSTSEWLTVTEVSSVTVPSDAWYGWDTANREVVNPPAGTTAKVKVTVNWGDVIGNVMFHDGTTITLADFLVTWPLDFEQADENSPYYDAGTVSDFQQFRESFKGMRVVSESPLVIEYYTDYINSEAEFILTSTTVLGRPGNDRWRWPEVPWQVTAIGMQAELNDRLAFSAAKAATLDVEWMNYIGGPSLAILNEIVTQSISTPFIPFGEFGQQYISEAEASARYQSLKDWYDEYNHFWIATGPFYLEQVDFTGHSAVILAFRDYTYPADRWAHLAEPPIPVVSTDLPDSVVPGIEAIFTINLERDGEAYPNDRIDFLKYMILDGRNDLVTFGEATPAGDGEWEASVAPETTSAMTAGSYRILTIAMSKDVAVPGKSDTPFVVIPAVSYFQSQLSQTQSQLESRIAQLETTLQQNQQTLTELQQQIEQPTAASNTLIYVAIVIALAAILVAVYPYLRKE